MSLQQSVNARVRDTVRRSLPSPIPLVQTALSLLLCDDSAPILATVIGAFAAGPVATDVGAALNLIQLGLQRLHVGVGDRSRGVLGFDDAAAVLIGDYMTSGAFKLIAACPDMRVLKVIGAAMTKTCELETAASGTARPDGEARLALLGPMGEAAGRCGGLLAGYAGSRLEDAAEFGRRVVEAHAAARPASAGARSDQPSTARLDAARRIAHRLALGDRHHRALELVDALSSPTVAA